MGNEANLKDKKILSKEVFKSLLNLNGSNLMPDKIWERQSEVIRKGFNFLNNEGNNLLYIADEVGLGKTYIALGIASLLRYYSDEPEKYQDIILVPKDNLQKKWEREIRSFIKSNFLSEDNRVKTFLGNPVGEIEVHQSLEGFSHDTPAYHLFRHTSFSFRLKEKYDKSVVQDLKERLKIISNNDEKILEIYKRGAEIWKKGKDDSKTIFKYILAYLLGICLPKLEFLIVDEAHNFKSGQSDDEENSDRNELIGRFFGIIRNSDKDKIIFEEFPELKGMIKPKVDKVLFLSATPKTNSLLEIKNQADCFLDNHILKNLTSDEDIKKQLHKFLIRGKMTYDINGIEKSRNQVREEYRKGNLLPNDKPISIKDGKEALFMGLIQFKTMEMLNKDSLGARFEAGMLASFETYKVDSENTKSQYEDKKKKVGEPDREVVLDLYDSYCNEVEESLPHPKEIAITQASMENIKNGEKSLIFVKRVSSVQALEKRINEKYEEWIFEYLQKIAQDSDFKSEALDKFLAYYNNQKSNRDLKYKKIEVFKKLADKITIVRRNLSNIEVNMIFDEKSDEEFSDTFIYFLNKLYNQTITSDKNKLNENLLLWKDLLDKQLALNNIKSELVSITQKIFETQYNEFIDKDDLIRNNEEEEENLPFFFHNYFYEKGTDSFRKNKLDEYNWKEEYTDELLEIDKDYKNSKNILVYCLNTIFREQTIKFLKNYKNESEKRDKCNTLGTLFSGSLRHGLGFLPLYIIEKSASEKSIGELFSRLITDKQSPFFLVYQEFLSFIENFRFILPSLPKDTKELNKIFTFQTPIKGMSGNNKNKSKVASQFRLPGYPLVLVCTDIYREGEDLHTHCRNIYHYGLAWNSTDNEQRIGRLDRINSLSHRKLIDGRENGSINIFYPYIPQTIEVNQVFQLFKNVDHFVTTFDKLENSDETTEVDPFIPIKEMPQPINEKLEARYDHDKFLEDWSESQELGKMQSIGSTSKESITKWFFDLITQIKNSEESPENINQEGDWVLKGILMVKEKSRKAPFRIEILEGEEIGSFKISLKAQIHTFKRNYKVILENKVSSTEFQIDEDGSNFFLVYKDDSFFKIPDVSVEAILEKLIVICNKADSLEEENFSGEDSNEDSDKQE